MTAPVEPIVINQLPLGPSTDDPDNFDNDADDFVAALPVVITQQNAANMGVYQNAVAAKEAAGNAASSQGIALGYAQTAMGYRDTTLTYRNSAQVAQAAAEAARDLALGYAAAMVGASTTPLVIGVGSKTFTGAGLAGKQFYVGQRVRGVNPAEIAQRMDGEVTAYVSNGANSSLTVLVDSVNSDTNGNTVANWTIGPGGTPGEGKTGGINGGNLAGALNELKASSVPVSATPDIWSGAGNYVELTGNGAVTGLPAAPQPGARRDVLVSGSPTITASANLIIKGVSSGSSITLAAGDEVRVVAETTTKFRLTIFRGDGTPIAHDRGALHSLRLFTSSGVFTASKTGWHKITLTGGSASGSVASGVAGSTVGAAGAGAGAFASGMRWLVAGTSYVVTVGAAAVAVQVQDGALQGNPGNAVQFSGPGVVSMTANGGQPGGVFSTTGAGGGGASGGPGGTAVGAPGDTLVTGGPGGSVTTLSVGSVAAGGGGAVGIRGTGFKGGDASANGGTAAAGGAGVGGVGGIATNTNAGNSRAAGGGAAGPGAAVTNGTTPQAGRGINVAGQPGGAAQTTSINPLENANGGGGDANDLTVQDGGGSAGQTGAAANAGRYAGTGGAAGKSNQSLTSGLGGDGGGAPGGVATLSTTSASFVAYGAPGTVGSVTIEF